MTLFMDTSQEYMVKLFTKVYKRNEAEEENVVVNCFEAF